MWRILAPHFEVSAAAGHRKTEPARTLRANLGGPGRFRFRSSFKDPPLKPTLRVVLFAVVLLGASGFLTTRTLAQRSGSPLDDFKKTVAMLPMRDGVRLHTVMLWPKGVKGPLPILFLRTPYGADGRMKGW